MHESGALALDTQQADLALLQQNLKRSMLISTRATLKLSEFDDRLARLEKTVSAIHKDTLPLQRVNTNIQNLLVAVEARLAQSDSVVQDELIVNKGPRLNHLDAYKDALARLVDAYEEALKLKGKRDADQLAKRLNVSIENGATSLGQILLGWVREASPRETKLSKIPPQSLDKIANLANFIDALPESSSGILAAQKDMQKSYAEVRGQAVATCLEYIGKQILSASSLDSRGVAIDSVIDVLLQSAHVEATLAAQIFQSNLTFIFRCYCAVVLSVFSDIGQQINNQAKKSITTMAAVAFKTFAILEVRQAEFEEQIRHKAGRKENEVGDLKHGFRATCLNAFTEFLDELKYWGNKPAIADAAPGQIADMTKNTIMFMRCLCDYSDIAERFLQTLGDGNWNTTRSKNAPVVTPRLVQGNQEPILLEKYLGDLLAALLAALESKITIMRTNAASSQSSIAPIFFLNNIAFTRREILSSSIGDFLGTSAEDDLNKRNRSAKTLYLEVFSGLVSSLMDTTSAKMASNSASGGDKFSRFGEALKAVENVHRLARLDPGEEEMRERLRSEVSKMVIPTYRSMASRNTSNRHIMSSEEVEDRLDALFV